MLRLVAMTRVSGLAQETNTSLEYQYKRIEAWATMNDAVIVYSILPAVESATAELSNRPVLQHALQAMEACNADGLIVFDIDRFFRHVSEALSVYRKYFEARGRRLIACQQSFDASTLEGWFIFVQFLLFAEYAGRKQNARMQEGKQCARHRQQWTGGMVQYGFRLDENSRLVVDEEEEKVISLIREFNARGMGASACARKLNELGYRKRTGKEWNPGQVTRILANSRVEHGAMEATT